jgi:hypothetical protein
MKTILRRLLYLQILITFILTGVWMRFPGAPGSFHPFYATGFLIFWPALASIILWMILGLPGIGLLWRDRLRRGWMLAVLLLACWALLSWGWAYTTTAAINRPGASLAASVPFVLALIFGLVTACAGPPLRWIAAALIVSALLSGGVGGLQVAGQSSSGLGRLGELKLDPQQSGVAVVQAEGVRWLRAYGLLPHPNILAGLLVAGVLANMGFFLSREAVQPRRAGTLLLVLIIAALLWFLGLTFSRAAWLGLVVGAVTLLLLTWRHVSRRLMLALAAVVALIGIAFAALYFPFLSARATATEPLEQRSISDRIVYTDMAWRAIGESPIIGWGMGNFPWRASYYLTFTDFDLRGQQVHHIYLAAWAELGLVGLGLFIAAFALGIIQLIRHYRPASIPSLSSSASTSSPHRPITSSPSSSPITRHSPLSTSSPHHPITSSSAICHSLLACILAWAVIGFFDHYPWTILHMQIIWWGLLGAMQHKLTA